MTFYLGTKGELEFLELEIGEEFLGKRLNKLSSFHPAIKFATEYSKETIDLNIILTRESSWQICLLSLPIHQALLTLIITRKERHMSIGLNRICSDNERFDKRCSNLGRWLMKRGYNGSMIRKQISRDREHSRKLLLERKIKTENSEPKLMFNITYYPFFENIRNIL